MADEYIRREDAIKYAEHAYHEWNLAMAAADGKREINLVYKRQELCKAVESVFRDMPAADVAPVVHGKWVHSRYDRSSGQFDVVKCSRCGLEAYAMAYHVRDGNYCPRCGARMDGGNEDDP